MILHVWTYKYGNLLLELQPQPCDSQLAPVGNGTAWNDNSSLTQCGSHLDLAGNETFCRAGVTVRDPLSSDFVSAMYGKGSGRVGLRVGLQLG